MSLRMCRVSFLLTGKEILSVSRLLCCSLKHASWQITFTSTGLMVRRIKIPDVCRLELFLSQLSKGGVMLVCFPVILFPVFFKHIRLQVSF